MFTHIYRAAPTHNTIDAHNPTTEVYKLSIIGNLLLYVIGDIAYVFYVITGIAILTL